MAFIVLEGFSGTGKTSLAQALEKRGWFRLMESAHALPHEVPVAERADTASDFSLLGATMMYSSLISKLRKTRNVVSEGYLLGDLAYAKIRYELKKSDAYPSMITMVRRLLQEPAMRPDLYLLLKASKETIEQRQMIKNDRERIEMAFFWTRFYAALAEIHAELGEEKVKVVHTDAGVEATLRDILEILEKSRVITA